MHPAAIAVATVTVVISGIGVLTSVGMILWKMSRWQAKAEGWREQVATSMEAIRSEMAITNGHLEERLTRQDDSITDVHRRVDSHLQTHP